MELVSEEMGCEISSMENFTAPFEFSISPKNFPSKRPKKPCFVHTPKRHQCYGNVFTKIVNNLFAVENKSVTAIMANYSVDSRLLAFRIQHRKKIDAFKQHLTDSVIFFPFFLLHKILKTSFSVDSGHC